jgi:hypothetical protein
MDELVAQTVREIEEEQELNRKSAVSVFRSMLNQPALVSISSANAVFSGSSESFSEFRVDLPRPILKVDTIQLLNANIPEATQNIPDTACVFWYYRLNSYYGAVPNPLNLYMVRLLPSYYKPEFEDPEEWGTNHTFFDYQGVAEELVKSCKADLCDTNLFFIKEFAGPDQPTIDIYLPEVPFSPNDIEITFDATLNKFQMTGLNTNLPLISFDYPGISTNTDVRLFDVGEEYDLGDYVYTNTSPPVLYKSLSDANEGNFPSISPSFWVVSTGDMPWSNTTTYTQGEFVTYDKVAYRSVVGSNLNHIPGDDDDNEAYWAAVQDEDKWIPSWNGSLFFPKNTIVYYAPSFSFWVSVNGIKSSGIPNDGNTNWARFVVPDYEIYNRYLITGYDDPNVVIRQGTQLKTWNPYNLFPGTDLDISTAIVYKDIPYLPNQQAPLLNLIPFQYPETWDFSRYYLKGDLVFSILNYYEAIEPSLNFIPAVSPSRWRLRTDLVYTGTRNYSKGDVVVYLGNSYIALQNNMGQTPSTTVSAGLNNAYWQSVYWERNYTQNATACEVGLNSLTSRYDMLDVVDNEFRFPFPSGIPGQPFNPNPKRLLNSILGFTWNGQMDPTVLDTIINNIPVASNNTVVQLYNRVRPVPQYTTPVVGAGLGATEPYTQGTLTPIFTANGYANLVYTSVVSIYGSIAGARTLDTQRNTSLLGLTSMNADNLGVSFYGNYIESELLANEEDLYSISIQLFDEFNEPFVLTNNAVVTLTFKMTYKNK